MAKAEGLSQSGDSQADKENDATAIVVAKKKRGRKKGSYNKPKGENDRIQRSIIDEPMATPDTKLSKQGKGNAKEDVEMSEKNLKQTTPISSNPQSSNKRMSLRKKTDTVSESPASKQEIAETPKYNSTSCKKSKDFEHPKIGYGLRRRGRKPKKSMIYKDEDNIILSHEKDEDMNKIDDSEFKLPNEECSKISIYKSF